PRRPEHGPSPRAGASFSPRPPERPFPRILPRAPVASSKGRVFAHGRRVQLGGLPAGGAHAGNAAVPGDGCRRRDVVRGIRRRAVDHWAGWMKKPVTLPSESMAHWMRAGVALLDQVTLRRELVPPPVATGRS